MFRHQIFLRKILLRPYAHPRKFIICNFSRVALQKPFSNPRTGILGWAMRKPQNSKRATPIEICKRCILNVRLRTFFLFFWPILRIIALFAVLNSLGCIAEFKTPGGCWAGWKKKLLAGKKGCWLDPLPRG